MALFRETLTAAGERPHVHVYTDGATSPNPGPGGWAALIRREGREWVLSGNEPRTTNNRMEVQAAIAALALLEGTLGPCEVDLYTDSQYLQQGIQEWLPSWVNRGWRTRQGRPVQNQDLWQRLYRLTLTHQVRWHWLPGHTGDPLNEWVDRLAEQARNALGQEATPRTPPPLHHPAGSLPIIEVSLQAYCPGGRGPGGWGAVLRKQDGTWALYGGERETTANAMLLQGAIRVLRSLEQPHAVTIYADSTYLVKGASEWIHTWPEKGWRTQSDRPVANREAWEALLQAQKPHQVRWVRVGKKEAGEDMARAGHLATEATAALRFPGTGPALPLSE